MTDNKFKKRNFLYPKKQANQEFQENNDMMESKFEESAEAKIFSISQNQRNYSSVAFLSNFRTVQIKDEHNTEITALLLIFYSQSGDWIHCHLKHDPYFLIKCSESKELEVLGFLEKKFEGKFKRVAIVEKVDLQTMNHLSGLKTRFVRCEFHRENDLLFVKSLIQKQLNFKKSRIFQRRIDETSTNDNPFEFIEGIREHDVNYSARVCIDFKIRVSFWYEIEVQKGFLMKIEQQSHILEKPEFPILAFDIETTKLPLKFPDSRIDNILLISYVIDKNTFLIVNRALVSEDIKEFVYTPKQEFSQTVNVFNEPDELSVIKRFIAHIKLAKPFVIVTYNGDMFDIPFVVKRAETQGVSLESELGLVMGRSEDTYGGKFMFCHLDCYYWVKRDAFLPQGSHGLKAVTKSKLGYNPIECDPEEIVSMAKNNPQKLAEYSVSDAVATFFLYTKHIHDFIFALCTIVPMVPDDVLRRGSGTLCEQLLMAKAYENDIVFPNKTTEEGHKYFKGYLIESETYVGGFVECLNNGAYRADIPIELKLDAKTYEDLVDIVDKVIDFYLRVEHPCGLSRENISNFKEVENQIKNQLLAMRDEILANQGKPILKHPLIYHVDVASMYPNIILTNRLQPTAIVDDQICSNCLFNESRNQCKRPLAWDWKVTHYPLKKLEFEKFLLHSDKDNMKNSLKVYCQKNYKSVHKTVVQEKENVVCMRENSFYVDTIRDFRDRRYDYKTKAKHFSTEESDWIKKGNFEKANESAILSVLFDSLQLAHKIILNSFYGYVMKKGARWYSMEMAAMVTHTGKNIIQEARNLFERVGKPLELDTDGIWTVLPKGFPEKFQLHSSTQRPLSFSFICSLINYLIYDKFKNTQYQDLDLKTNSYNIRNEMQIFFELDGPYKAMIIPASKEENKNLKKRYVVFNFENRISEIKGFEIKRRGELGMVKVFQSEIFAKFLEGNSLKTLYASCAETALKWLGILQTKAHRLSDVEVIELLGETKVLSRSVEDYGVQKGIALTAAKRLAQCLGESILKGTGLNCHFVISKSPENAPLNERAVPIAVFSFEEKQRLSFLKNWLKISDDANFSLKSILDWNYYIERLSSNIQKIIIIPAILQGLENPIPELECPDWLRKRVNQRSGVQNTLSFALKSSLQNDKSKLQKKGDLIKPILGANDPNIKNDHSDKDKIEVMDIENAGVTNIQSENANFNPIDKTDESSMTLQLLDRKKFWLSKRNDFKKSGSSIVNSLKSNNVALIMQSGSILQQKSVWQITKIEPTQTDGILKLFVILNGDTQTVRLINCKRVFYVNSFVEEQFDRTKLQLSKKQLPHEKQNIFLYEFEVEETVFQKSFWKFTDFITDCSKEGVYETNVPLDFRSILQLGSVCKPEGKISNNIISLSDLRTDFESEGLQFFKSSIFDRDRFVVFLWSISHRQTLITFVFCRNSLKILRLSKEGKNEAVVQSLMVFVREHLSNLFKMDSCMSLENEFRFTKDDVFIFKDKKQYSERLRIIKIEVESEVRKRPTLVVLNSKSLSASIEVSNTWSDIPVIEFKWSDVDKPKIDDLQPEKAFVGHFFEDLVVLEEKLIKLDTLASFARVPLCNLSGDYDKALMSAIDVVFGRELLKHNSVLWYSDERLPDLGVAGYNCSDFEDFLLAYDSQSVYLKPQLSLSYVVEVNVVKFFNGALLSMDQFVNLEREFGDAKSKRIQNSWNMSNAYSTYNKVGLKAIRSMFKTWIDELKRNDSAVAEDLLQKLVPWACSEDSKFYDPVIERTILFIAHSLFQSLLMKFQRMGMKVVYANPYKLFLDTRKYTLDSAQNAVKFVLESIVSDPSFVEVYFAVERFYKTFLFYNFENYHGFAHRFDDDEVEEIKVEKLQEVSNEVQINKKDTLETISYWNIQLFLPNHLQTNFLEYIEYYMRKWIELSEREELGSSCNPILENDKAARVEKLMEEFLCNELSSSLFEFLTELQERQREVEVEKFDHSKKKEHNSISNFSANKNAEVIQSPIDNFDVYSESSAELEELYDDSFIEDEEEIVEVKLKKKTKKVTLYGTPKKSKGRTDNSWREFELQNLIGGVKRTDNLSFEFMNLVMEVFSVNKESIQECVLGMKINYLKYFNLPFDAESATFQKLFVDCSLPNVVCSNSACDILKPVKIFQDYCVREKGWFCYCRHKYSQNLMEEKIIDYINNCYRLMVSVNPRCVKCKKVCTDHFSKMCVCHGELRKEKHPIIQEFEKEFYAGMINFKALAVSSEMKGLEDFLRSFLSGI